MRNIANLSFEIKSRHPKNIKGRRASLNEQFLFETLHKRSCIFCLGFYVNLILSFYVVVQQWRDEIMMWNPDEWKGIVAIGLSPDKIWTPDVIFSNS